MTTLLLVEDSEINRNFLSSYFTRKGYTVVMAINGAEGVVMASIEQPDLILMNMNLPVIDGWKATRQIKADPETRLIPVIALTDHAMLGDRDHTLAAGCDDYETKPIDLARLLHKITSLLEASVV